MPACVLKCRDKNRNCAPSFDVLVEFQRTNSDPIPLALTPQNDEVWRETVLGKILLSCPRVPASTNPVDQASIDALRKIMDQSSRIEELRENCSVTARGASRSTETREIIIQIKVPESVLQAQQRSDDNLNDNLIVRSTKESKTRRYEFNFAVADEKWNEIRKEFDVGDSRLSYAQSRVFSVIQDIMCCGAAKATTTCLSAFSSSQDPKVKALNQVIENYKKGQPLDYKKVYVPCVGALFLAVENKTVLGGLKSLGCGACCGCC